MVPAALGEGAGVAAVLPEGSATALRAVVNEAFDQAFSASYVMLGALMVVSILATVLALEGRRDG